MLGNTDAIATIAVKKIEPARKFYEGTLGLKPMPSAETGVQTYKSGNSRIPTATSSPWSVSNASD